MTFVKGGAAKSASGVVNDIGTSPDAKEYSSFASDVDLTADSPTNNTPARGLMITSLGAGTKIIQVVTAAGQTRAYDLSGVGNAPVWLPVAARTIKGTTTTIAKVIAFW